MSEMEIYTNKVPPVNSIQDVTGSTSKHKEPPFPRFRGTEKPNQPSSGKTSDPYRDSGVYGRSGEEVTGPGGIVDTKA